MGELLLCNYESQQKWLCG